MDEALAAQLKNMADAGNFESAEGAKDIPLDPKTPDGKALKISATLDSK